MKKVSRRALFALLLALVLLAGTGLFTARYFSSGKQWVAFSGSPHLYENGVLRSGVVKDRTGEVLLTLTGERIYAADALTRQANLHLLGDSSGNIHDAILEKYAANLGGFSTVFGTFSAKNEPKCMTLSVRNNVQKAAFSALDGRKGMIAVYDYVNGEILCAVSSPAYDPLSVPDFSEDIGGKYDGVYVNRFANAVYVPGSIFKLVTTACALDNLPDDILSRKFSCDGALEVGDDVVMCAGNHGELTLKEALAKSCNCAFGQLSIDLGPELLESYVNRMGLTETYAVDGLQTSAGRFDLDKSSDVDIAWAGIGQHTVMVNPYSFLRFLGAIAAETPAEPHFVVQIGNYNAQKRTFNLPISRDSATILTDFMENNVRTVYGVQHFPNLTVCAKSGTAEVGEGQMPHATFAGFVKDEKYPLAFMVVVENGGSGSETCSSIAGTVLTECVKAMDSAAE